MFEHIMRDVGLLLALIIDTCASSYALYVLSVNMTKATESLIAQS